MIDLFYSLFIDILDGQKKVTSVFE